MSLILSVVWILSQLVSASVFTETSTILTSSALKPQPPTLQFKYCDPDGDGKIELNLHNAGLF